MKKVFLILACVLALVLSTSCKKDGPVNDKDPDQGNQGTNTDPTTYGDIDKVITDEISTIDVRLLEDITLPTVSKDGLCTITWESTKPSYLTDAGHIAKRDKNGIVEVDVNYTVDNKKTSKGGCVTFKVYPRTIDYIARQFKSQISEELSESIDYIATTFEDLYYVKWHSSNTEVLTDEGVYHKLTHDTPVTISFEIYIDEAMQENAVYSNSFDIVVVGYTNYEKVESIREWIINDYLSELTFTEDMNFPTVDPEFNATLTWVSSDSNILESDGKVHRFVFDRYVQLDVKVELGLCIDSLTFYPVVEALDISKMNEQSILENFMSAICVSSIKRQYFGGYANITQTFNNLHFYDNVDEERIQRITAASMDNRPGIIKPSTEFIVVHDTANTRVGANGLAHANYVNEGGGGTSFQYVVGNDGIYHLIPDDEVAYHAGDGSRLFKLIDTGIKATAKRPNIGISEDGYFTFNGVKSVIAIPEGAYPTSTICSTGLCYEIGTNGNYWLNDNYYNATYQKIANKGGNRNSIGIETCVDQGSDYGLTLRYNEDLVARLLIENNISVDRVVQHNNLSGKDCPFAMRVAGYWQNFRDMVSLEKFGREHFEGYTFTWESGTTGLNNMGFIQSDVSGLTEVNYSVVVKKGDTTMFNQSFTTKIDK